MCSCFKTHSCGFDSVQFHILVIEEGREHSHGIAAASHTGNYVVRKTSGHLKHLAACLDSYHGLEIADHHREGMRADNRSDAVDLCHRIFQIRFESFIDGILERSRTCFDGNDLRTEYFHPRYIRSFLHDVDLPHVDVAFKAHERCCGCKGNAVLACTGFRNDFFLAHSPGKQNLAETVVDLVGACVIQVFSLEIYLCPSHGFCEVLCKCHGRRASCVMCVQLCQFLYERRIL